MSRRAKKANSFREKEVGGPPPESPWVWHTAELIRSDAWRGASLALRRMLDLLELRHLQHERKVNGNLIVTYDEFVKEAGIRRAAILQTIKEGETRKLIAVKRDDRLEWPLPTDGKLQPNLYRLTYFPTCTIEEKDVGGYKQKVTTWHRETNEWRSYREPDRVKRKPPPPRPRKSDSPVPSTELGPVPSTELGLEADRPKTAKNLVPSTEPKPSSIDGTVSTYLGAVHVGTALAATSLADA